MDLGEHGCFTDITLPESQVRSAVSNDSGVLGVYVALLQAGILPADRFDPPSGGLILSAAVLVRSLACDSSFAAPLTVAHKPHLGMHGRMLAQCTLACDPLLSLAMSTCGKWESSVSTGEAAPSRGAAPQPLLRPDE